MELITPMTLEIYIAYVVTATVVLVIPGPTILLVISQAITHGRKATLPLAAGVAFGDFTAMTLSLLGLGAIMAASATLFSVLKWIGALYLVYLGITHWRRPAMPSDKAPTAPMVHRNGKLFGRAYVVTALNPKGIVFFVAFLPQFVVPGPPALPQFALLGGTFLVLATVNVILYALFAGQLRTTLNSPGVRRWFDRCGGTALIGAGIITAATQRAA
jgi:homoserine/homoserine lactone efflux protein